MLKRLVCALAAVVALTSAPALGAHAPSPDSGGSGGLDAGTARTADVPKRRAFPGAQGYGARTPGGRGGKVILVTNLRNSGPGSLRAALTAKGPRIVVFRVSGTITLKSAIDVYNPYLTVAGQTAPGGGITLRASKCNGDGTLGVHTHDVVIRFVRFRVGPHPCAGEGESSDGIVVYKRGAHHVVIDHSSISWAVDENLSTYDHAHHVTMSWNIVSEGLANSTHEEGEHSKGVHLSGDDSYKISFHHNLLAHNMDRNPQPTNPGLADIRNNIVYNYGDNAALTSNSHGKPRFNFVGNMYIPGRDTDREEYGLDVYGEEGLGWAFFVKGNIGPHRRSNELPQRRMVSPEGRSAMVGSPFDTARVTTTSAWKARRQVLDRAGATFPHRDAVDRRIVRDVRQGTGRIIDSPAEVGGWPRLPATRPPADADRDGMPNGWERRHGLNPNRKNAGADADRDGWTNIEEYVNGLVRGL